MSASALARADASSSGSAVWWRLSSTAASAYAVTRSAIAGVTGALAKVRREEYADALAKIKAEFAAAGITIAGVESHPVPAEKIKLGGTKVESKDKGKLEEVFTSVISGWVNEIKRALDAKLRQADSYVQAGNLAAAERVVNWGR